MNRLFQKNKMVRVLLFVGTFLSLASLPAEADNDNYNQWASMEFKQWSFTPKSYYYSWYYKRGPFGIKYKVPGKGIHDHGPGGVGLWGDGYVRQRWRQMTPLRAEAVVAATLDKEQVNSIKEYWDDIRTMDLSDLADKKINLATQVDKDSRKAVIRTLASLVEKLEVGSSEQILDEYNRIKENLEIIGDAFLPNSDKMVAYEKELKRLEKLRDCSYVLMVLQETSKVLCPKESGLGEYEPPMNFDIN